MATIYTANLKLGKPAIADRNWNLPLNSNADQLDAMAPIAGLFVSSTELPSTSLNVRVASGGFVKSDASAGSFAGSSSYTLTANSTRYVYLDGAGNLTNGTAWPATSHVRLAIVVTGASTITSITDSRVTCHVIGSDALPYLATTGGTMAEGGHIAVGTSTGTKIGTATTQKLGFFGATPIVRGTAFTQVYTTADRTISAYSASNQSSSYSGIASGVGGTPYAALTDLNALRAAYENLRALAEDTTQALNALVDDLQALGLIG
jgi:hypothetical protein